MNVVASFTMLVRVKRGSIAILRTMGASPGTIVRAFFMAAAASTDAMPRRPPVRLHAQAPRPPGTAAPR